METRSLSGLRVPVIGMGSGNTFDVEDPNGLEIRRNILDNCLTSGSTFIDTSPMYGRAERAIGIAMQGRSTEYQFATKVWCSGVETGRRQIARSFELLRTPHIHVFQIHNMVDWKTHLPYLEGLQEKGDIDLIGVTYTYPSGFPEMMEIMNTGRIQTIQISYNVLERTPEEEILPLAAELGIGVIVMRPLGSGKLAKGFNLEPDLGPLSEFGIQTWPQALLSWVLGETRVQVLIPSSTQPDRITQNATAGSLPLLPQEMRDYVESEARRCFTL